MPAKVPNIDNFQPSFNRVSDGVKSDNSEVLNQLQRHTSKLSKPS